MRDTIISTSSTLSYWNYKSQIELYVLGCGLYGIFCGINTQLDGYSIAVLSLQNGTSCLYVGGTWLSLSHSVTLLLNH